LGAGKVDEEETYLIALSINDCEAVLDFALECPSDNEFGFPAISASLLKLLDILHWNAPSRV
jgi:hypothetical protein